jgi:hypothetical protein
MSKPLPSLSQRFILRPLARDDEPFLWEMLYQAIYVPPHLPPPDRSIIESPDLVLSTLSTIFHSLVCS